LLKADAAISTRLERIVPNSAATVEAVFHDSDTMANIVECIFEDAGPAIVKSEAVAGIGNDSQVKESE